jgi:DNA-binding CsgD family transcriptional regulator
MLLAVAGMALLGDTGVDVLALTSEALALVPADPPSPLHARIVLVHARALEDRGRDDQAAIWATEAQRLARALDLPEVVVDAATLFARLERRAGDPEAARRGLEASIADARAAGEVGAEMRGLFTLGGLHFERGNLAEAREIYAAATALANRSARPWAPYGLDARAMGAIVAQVQGDWDDARRIVDVRGAAPPAMAEAVLAAVDLFVLAGRGSDRVFALLPQIRPWWDRDGLVAILSGSAAIDAYAARGEVEAALAVHDEVVETVRTLWQRKSFAAQFRLGSQALAALTVEAVQGSTRDRAELVARGEQLAARAAEAGEMWRTRRPGPEGQAWMARLQAELLRLRWAAGVDAPDADTLVAAWREALGLFEVFGNVFEVARSQARLAEALRAAGLQVEATPLVAAARATAARLGAQPLLDELRLLGRARPPVQQAVDDSLTPREEEVLALVAAGRSNREIAGRLFISTKTVSVHVSNILAKLGAAGRTEAVAIARRRGLLSDETPSPT